LVSTTRQRFHNAAGTGPLGTISSGVLARVSYNGFYYDTGDRLTDSVNVGTNGGVAWTRPATAPPRSDTVLVTSQAYDAAGRAFQTTDPRGLKTQLTFDALGRITQSVQNYVNGPMSDTDNKTVQFVYGPAGQTKVRVLLPGGGEQTTETVFGVSQAAGDKIDSFDVAKQTKHPDATTGLPSSLASDTETVTVNGLGEVLTRTDRNGNVHTYAYDVVGRPTSDAVTTLGAGVAGNIRRIETAYDGQGNAYLITSYTAASGGTVVNQVRREFNGLGQLTTEWQAHSGAVNTGTTPKVQYVYSFNPVGSNNDSRLTRLTYPNGKDIDYLYTGVGQVSQLFVNTAKIEEYNYLGLGTVVERMHAVPDVDLTYVKQGVEGYGDAGDQYIGLDRFGRVVDQRWRKTTDNSNVDRYQYTYDRDSNRTSRTNVVNTGFNEAYGYDGLNQLTSFNKTGTTKSWDYDAVGNWDGVTTNGSTEGRTHNRQNRLLSATGQTSPTYDANGNQTKDFGNLNYTYDAWNRPRTASSRTYEYDGLGRRIQRTVSTTTSDFYYDDQWRILEDRIAGAVNAHYVWVAAGYVDEMVLRDRDADGNPATGLEERLYAAQDANYNVTAVFGNAGGVQERFTYDPYGERSIYGPAWGVRTASSWAWVFNHQGLRFDPVTGKYHARNRDYDPAEGRWMTEDPIGFGAQDPNFFDYQGNNPANRLDSSGLSWTPHEVWCKLTDAQKKEWQQLAAAGWTMALDRHGTMTRALKDNKRKVRFEITNKMGITIFKNGNGVLWDHVNHNWLVSFEGPAPLNKVIAIHADDDDEAAQHLVNIMSLLSKTGPKYDIDIFTGKTTLEAILERGRSDSPFAPGRGEGIDPARQDVLEGLKVEQRRLILMLQRTEGMLSAEAVGVLMKMNPVMRPDNAIAALHGLYEAGELAKLGNQLQELERLKK
jgi:RHS repeat-associated protein